MYKHAKAALIVSAGLLWPAAMPAAMSAAQSGPASQARQQLVVPIQPLPRSSGAPDLQSALIPLSDGSVIDFAGWMAQKYGVGGFGAFESEAARLDRETGRTTLTVYGLDRVEADAFVEGKYDFRPQLPGCGVFTRILWGESKCEPNWQMSGENLVGNGVLSPQMVGIVDFNSFTALTPADMELGKIRFGPPDAILSMVP